MEFKGLAIAAAALAALAAPQGAQATQLGSSISGSGHGLTWTASSAIVGVNSTATLAGGGDPRYFAAMPKYSGVVSLIMDYGSAGKFICSGSLVSPTAIVTAAHCMSGEHGHPLSTTAYFYGGSNPDTVVYTSPASTAINVSAYAVNPLYTKQVIDQNDVAVLRLAQAAPAWATIYGMDFSGNTVGQTFNVAGYGMRSLEGGSVGADLGPGRLRQGYNQFDFTLGDPAWQGLFTSGFFDAAGLPHANVAQTLISDFDSGRPVNDASCLLADDFGAAGPQFCNTGLGKNEVSIAGGDSGGPDFINGKLVAVNSFSLSFGASYGDLDNKLNSSFGEFAGYAPLAANEAFIMGAIPEPATWAMMLLGLGFAGSTLRRRAQPQPAHA